MKKMKNMKVRVPMYFIGLFIMTIGISISVKSDLGVSPVSSIPYTMTCVWGIEMGRATILFHCLLVLAQILLLRRKFKPKALLQIVVGIIFGYFTTFCNYLVSFAPDPQNLAIRILMMLLSTVLIAAGIFFYLPPNLIPLAGEGAMQAVSEVTGIEFSHVKIAFDCSMVAISAVVCLITIHSLGSVGIGTIIAAVLVGTILGWITKAFGAWRDRLLQADASPESEAETANATTPAYADAKAAMQAEGKKDGNIEKAQKGAETAPAETFHIPSVITISREFGSGGREIAKLLADRLGYRYCDAELVDLIAAKSGLSKEYVRENEQSVKNPALADFFHWYTYPVSEEQLPNPEKLFHAEENAIHEIASEGPCVIVGRLSNIILKDNPDAFHVFVYADEENETAKVMKRDGLSEEDARAQVRKVNRERAQHCRYFTQTQWGQAKNYNLCVRSDDRPYSQTVDLITEACREPQTSSV